MAEVAHRVGYSHQGRFAEAFKRRFMITPSECLFGKKSI
ncbi:helix-turn-helix domain-containing protein [Gloeocapsopsis crepidinum]|nr:helix-turn-helix domain-containing protein [Gloeocapsopsis crepidinum]